MKPDNAPVGGTFVRIDGVKDRNLSCNRSVEVFGHAFGGSLVALACVGEPFVETVTMLWSRRVAENSHGALRGSEPPGAVQGHMPVTRFGQIQCAVRQPIGALKLGPLRGQFALLREQ